jgi:hypothetical protein
LRGLLAKDPEKRVGARGAFEEVKKADFCRGIDWVALAKK